MTDDISILMKERPILFSAPMVRVLLEGRKTQTRRVVKPQPPSGHNFAGFTTHSTCSADEGKAVWAAGSGPLMHEAHRVRCPYGQPGDRLWVREAWRLCREADGVKPRDTDAAYRCWYEADAPHQPGFGRLRPGMFMPRWASRITLEITEVRVQRVQEISEEGAIAEGIERDDEGRWTDYQNLGFGGYFDHPIQGARFSFASLWDSINAKRGFGWDANPWVWCLSFRRVA